MMLETGVEGEGKREREREWRISGRQSELGTLEVFVFLELRGEIRGKWGNGVMARWNACE